MVSKALTVLRGTPEKQAARANATIAESFSIRHDVLTSGPQKLAALQRLSSDSIDVIEQLLADANDAERQVRSALSPSSTASADSLAKIRWVVDSGLSLQSICEQLVKEADRNGLVALRQTAPWAIRAGKLSFGRSGAIDKAIDYAIETIARHEQSLYTTQERLLSQEVRECDISGSYIKGNHKTLMSYFEVLTTPQAVSGMHAKPEKLMRWQGLPGDDRPKGFIDLQSDVVSPDAASYSNAPVDDGSSQAPTGGYLVDGSGRSQWTETATRRR